MNETQLKNESDYLRCPRCGDESESVEVKDGFVAKGWFVRCLAADCDLESPIRGLHRDALDWWNRPFNDRSAA